MNRFKYIIPGVAAAMLGGAVLADKPNVVIIYGDDVGYGDVGAYGSKMIRLRISTGSRLKGSVLQMGIVLRQPVLRLAFRC